ncbi:hypothetical protein TRFO_10966 [Tritrichomonas foetus]|uniref:Uncharacterized protein n=1 Tax=Tritrichomonas foetus TaxID=1144522 RepID=A0A1J4J8N2_9EUKA|nr:hypothetical protein TRFO_10966 [Tritrichomonas foetus]|eukprot:OHS94599.1 hypothetical protein TRFO_10966 [Tritrichomonas foetus]
MNYKNQALLNPPSLLDSTSSIDDIPPDRFKTPKTLTNESIDFQKLFAAIESFYLENQDIKVLELLDSAHKITDLYNSDSYEYFNKSNIASILLSFPDPKYSFDFHRAAILSIIDSLQSDEEQFLDKFLNLSLFSYFAPLMNETYFIPFILLINSIYCSKKHTFLFMKILNLDFSQFFSYLIQNGTRNIRVFLKSFEYYVSDFTLLTNDHKLEIFKGIEKICIHFPIECMHECLFFFQFLSKFTEKDDFYFFLNQTNLCSRFIELIYRYSSLSQKDDTFFFVLLALLTFLSQDGKCPTIPEHFMIDLCKKYFNERICAEALFIIGNQCKLSSSQDLTFSHDVYSSCDVSIQRIQQYLQSDFLGILMNTICNGAKYVKTEAIVCLAKILSACSNEQFEMILNFMNMNLVDVLEFFVDIASAEIEVSIVDLIQAIMRMLEDAKKKISEEEYQQLLQESDVFSLLELENMKDFIEEEAEGIEALKKFIMKDMEK